VLSLEKRSNCCKSESKILTKRVKGFEFRCRYHFGGMRTKGFLFVKPRTYTLVTSFVLSH
jgi:hypothetical protein